MSNDCAVYRAEVIRLNAELQHLRGAFVEVWNAFHVALDQSNQATYLLSAWHELTMKSTGQLQ